MEILSITGKGNPCFCDGLPINDIKKKINIEAENQKQNTSKVLRLYIKYKEAINAKPAMVWMLLAQKQNKSIDVHVLLLGLTMDEIAINQIGKEGRNNIIKKLIITVVYIK